MRIRLLVAAVVLTLAACGSDPAAELDGGADPMDAASEPLDAAPAPDAWMGADATVAEDAMISDDAAISDDATITHDATTAVDATPATDAFVPDACVLAHPDGDADGHGDPASTGCLGAGFVVDATDCDDTRATVHPGAAESCNGIDDDCDGIRDASDPDAALACPAGPHGAPRCDSIFLCTYTCEAGWLDCSSGGGCETDSLVSSQHCGACNTRCEPSITSSAECVAGTCERICNPGYATCPGITAACGTPLDRDTHCGACGVVCAAGQTCMAGACRATPSLTWLGGARVTTGGLWGWGGAFSASGAWIVGSFSSAASHSLFVGTTRHDTTSNGYLVHLGTDGSSRFLALGSPTTGIPVDVATDAAGRVLLLGSGPILPDVDLGSSGVVALDPATLAPIWSRSIGPAWSPVFDVAPDGSSAVASRSVAATDAARVVALAPDGTVRFDVPLTGPSIEDIRGVAALDAGGVVVAGSFSTSMTIGATTVSAPGFASFVASLAADGTTRWVRTVSATTIPSDGTGQSLVGTIDARGAVVGIGGWFGGTLTLGALSATSTGANDGFVAWLDLATGTPLDLVPAVGLGEQRVSVVALDATGVLRALGHFDSAVSIGARTRTGIDTTGNSFVAGFSSSRALRFLTLQPTTRYDFATGLEADSGRFLLLGAGETSTDVGGMTINLGVRGVFVATFVDP